jgi:cob(I)alamin adenosyltransferase
MSITTKKGDSGYTSLLRGHKVPKYHPATESTGCIDETNSLLGLARASSNDRKIKRIILQVQKHLFVIGAELSVPKGYGRPPAKIISEKEIRWLEKLIENFEDVLALPPGFVAFGQERSASQLDVVRTSVRKAERMVVKMKNDDMIENQYVIKYLNRLSDLIFLLACFEEKDENARRKIGRSLFNAQLSDPLIRKWTIFSGLLILTLVVSIVLILIFHKPSGNVSRDKVSDHVEEMNNMHNFNKE